MSLDLSLFQIEDGLRDLYAMREEARERLSEAQNAPGVLGDLPEESEIEALDNAIKLYIGAELKKVDGTADFILMLDRLCHEPRERKGVTERCELDQEIDRLKARRDSLRGVMQHVKDAVKFVMEGMPWREGKPKKLEGVRHSITLRGNGGAQPVEITDESLVPDEYKHITITMSLDLWMANGVRAFAGCEVKHTAPEISKSSIAEALQKTCELCGGEGRINTGPLEGPDTWVNCLSCGGSGKQGVPGAKLAERGSSVIVK